MAEPAKPAGHVDVVIPGVVHWSVEDMRIDFRGDAYGVSFPEGQILIDPLPLTPDALRSLGKIGGVCMGAGQHQRACWQYRRDLGVPPGHENPRFPDVAERGTIGAIYRGVTPCGEERSRFAVSRPTIRPWSTP